MRIRSRLAERTGGSMALALIQIGGGVMMTLLVAAVAAFLLAFAGMGMSFALRFWICWIALTPVLLWYERRTRGAATEGMLDGFDDRPASYGEWEMRRTTGVAILWLEFFLIGPRLIYWGVDHWRERHSDAPVDLERAAQVVMDLLVADGGVHPKQLLHENETLADLAPVLRYLERQDWVGIAKRRDRVWLLTEARSRL